MPHLSLLADKYKNSVIVVGVDIMERNPSMKKLKAFVDSMGSAMDYLVAAEDSNFMTTIRFKGSGEDGTYLSPGFGNTKN